MCMYDMFIFHFVILVSYQEPISYYYSTVLIYTVLIYFVNIFSVNWLAIFNRDFFPSLATHLISHYIFIH